MKCFSGLLSKAIDPSPPSLPFFAFSMHALMQRHFYLAYIIDLMFFEESASNIFVYIQKN